MTDQIRDFFEIVIHPKERMQKEVKKADVNEAMKTFAIAGAVIGFFIGLMIAFVGTVAGAVTGNPLGGLGIAAIVIVPIILAILAVVGSAISYGVMWLVANLLGGKGTFEQNYYLGSRLLWPVVIASIVTGILSMIPILGVLIHIVWTLYTIYLAIVLIAVANKLDMGRAFVAWLIPVILILAIMAFVFGLALAGVIGAMAAGRIQ